MQFDRYLGCPNEDCQFHEGYIWLPPSSPTQTDDDPASWPGDGTYLFVACPGCRLVSSHCYAGAGDRSPSSQTSPQIDEVWIRVSFLCEQENCKTPAEFHVLVAKAEDKQIRKGLIAKLQVGHWTGTMPCGHELEPMSGDNFDFDRPLGSLKGYNPDRPRQPRIRRKH